MSTRPVLSHDTLAAAIAAQHYSSVLFPSTPDRRDAVDFARECVRRIADDNAILTPFTLLDALADVVSDDLHDFAHNANHADYAPIFHNVDADSDRLFRMFTSDDVANRVALILFPFIDNATREL